MKIIKKQEFIDMPRGTVFAEISRNSNYELDSYISPSLNWMVKDDYEFGATCLMPTDFYEDELFDF